MVHIFSNTHRTLKYYKNTEVDKALKLSCRELEALDYKSVSFHTHQEYIYLLYDVHIIKQVLHTV